MLQIIAGILVPFLVIAVAVLVAAWVASNEYKRALGKLKHGKPLTHFEAGSLRRHGHQI